jgi:CubicO group peptidase (beta-lactamase class C family)
MSDDCCGPMSTKSSFSALLLAGATSCFRDERPLEERLQATLDDCLVDSGVKGADVAVIPPDETLWRGVTGISHGTVKMSPDMSFAIGSITKNMVAALVLRLAEERKLSLEDSISQWLPPYPEKLAHVWGQNFEKDGVYRDETFLPRTSHDSITYGSAGVFMTAEDLARWTHSLFQGRVISQESLAQMQVFAAEGSHGLGLDRLGWRTAGPLGAVGHGGANIGTSAYMVYLPDYDVSIAVMINHFGGKVLNRIVRDLSRVAALSVKPESVFSVLWSPEGLLSRFWLVAGVSGVLRTVCEGSATACCAETI